MNYLPMISIIALVIAIIIGFLKKINMGIIGIAIALILGHIGGIGDKDIIAQFGTPLFIRLLGITLLFSIANTNGTMEKITKKMVSLFKNFPKLIPWLVFFISLALGCVAGTIAVWALMCTISCAIAYQMKINPFKLVPFGIFGAMVGSFTSVSMTGVLAKELATNAGIDFPYTNTFVIAAIFFGLLVGIFYFISGWHKLKFDGNLLMQEIEPMSKNEIITLIGVAVMILLAVVFSVDVGLASIAVACVLLILSVSDQKASIAGVPWGTLIMITGMGILIGTVNQLGGIGLISNGLSNIMTAKLAPSIFTMLGGVMSFVSSAQGVVWPTLFPTIPDIVTSIGGNVSEYTLAVCVILGTSPSSISPFSTGGALIMGAYATICKPTEKECDKMYMNLIWFSVIGVVFFAILAGLGLAGIQV